VLTGPGVERTFCGELPFITADSLLVEEGRTQVPVDASRPDNTKRFKAVRPLNLCAHLKAPHSNGVKAAPASPPDGGGS
jgi:hypothetical protein